MTMWLWFFMLLSMFLAFRLFEEVGGRFNGYAFKAIIYAASCIGIWELLAEVGNYLGGLK